MEQALMLLTLDMLSYDLLGFNVKLWKTTEQKDSG